MEESLLATPLHSWHCNNGGRMVPFGGWEMPVQYSSIVQEHSATRNRVGLFDISHMGRLQFSGADAASLLDNLLTNEVKTLKPGQIRYSLVTNENGFVLDDVLVYRSDDPQSDEHMLVVNASNRTKIVDWIARHQDRHTFQDRTFETSMIAVQGPNSAGLIRSVVGDFCDRLRYYRFASWPDAPDCLVSRTGYTGEIGYELIVPAARAENLWTRLCELGETEGLEPCGLGARDTLRLEAAMPLYGHELTEQIDPWEANLAFAVKLQKPQFIGKEALVARQQQCRRTRIGLELTGKRIAREGYRVAHNGMPIGEVTSGTFSPTLQKSIAMALVDKQFAADGTSLEVDLRGRPVGCKVVPLPFYSRAS